jgi:hypothetical protein
MPASVPAELVELVESASKSLSQIEDHEASIKPSSEKWSKKELLGHLIDSAVNNHHQFVRAQRVDEFVFPHYEQEHWVACQRYKDREWSELIELWRLYNRHLAHVIKLVPESSLTVTCTIGPYEPVSLRALIDDYLVHLKHHLKQIGIHD